MQGIPSAILILMLDKELTCSKCGSDQLFFAIAGDHAMIACKACAHIENRELTPEIKADINRRMQGNSPWKDQA